MKKIRTGVWETNSSSCHSVSVSSSGDYTSITPNASGSIIIPSQGFGWEQETYNDPLSKLSYLCIYVRDWAREQNRARYFSQIWETVVDHTHCYNVSFAGEDDGSGYIDHQSVESNDLDWIFEDKKIKDFVFDRGSYIETDNDNH